MVFGDFPDLIDFISIFVEGCAKNENARSFKMNRSCNYNNTGKGRRCDLCNDREKRLANVPRGLNPVDCLSGGSKDCKRGGS
jgi:hypothetical protein